MSEPQDRAEALDDDRIGPDFPPEEPLGAEDYGITGAEQRYDEPLEERIQREEPDGPGETGAPLVEPASDAGEDGRDDEKDLVADAEVSSPRPEDDPAGEVGRRDASAAERVPPAAEVSAVHLDR